MHQRRSVSEMSDNGGYTKKKVISAFAAAASGANILLATGPFVLPLGYCKMGYILSPILMLFSMIFGYIFAYLRSMTNFPFSTVLAT